ncbi:MAG: hypothetical protein ABIP06_13270 [Pyrinomonadaceae bacterium]
MKLEAASILEWNDRLLIPLYHPSPQVIDRRMHEQLADFQILKKAIERTINSQIQKFYRTRFKGF